MRDLLSKLDALVSETALKDKEDLEAKRQALNDLEADPVASEDPEISAAIDQRRADLEKEAKSKGFDEDQDIYQIGDSFGISFSEDFEIGTEIIDILEDGIVIDLDETALDFLSQNGFTFEEVSFNEEGGDPEIKPGMKVSQGTVVKVNGNTVVVKTSNGDLMTMNIHDVSMAEGRMAEEKQKGLDGKACWKGYRRMGTKMKGGKRVDNCVKVGESQFEDAGSGEFSKDDDLKSLFRKLQNDGLEKEVRQFINWALDSGMYNMQDAIDHGAKVDWDEINFPGAYEGWERAIEVTGYNPGDSSVGEAKYQGREVPLGKPMKGDVKKSKVYVRGPKGNVVKANFGDKKMRIKKSNPNRRKSFRARHNCSNPGPRWKARYWSCRAW